MEPQLDLGFYDGRNLKLEHDIFASKPTYLQRCWTECEAAAVAFAMVVTKTTTTTTTLLSSEIDKNNKRYAVS